VWPSWAAAAGNTVSRSQLIARTPDQNTKARLSRKVTQVLQRYRREADIQRAALTLPDL